MKIRKRTLYLTGYGGRYEAMCQTMLWRGIEYLTEMKPPWETMWRVKWKAWGKNYEYETTPERDKLQAELRAAMLKPGEDLAAICEDTVPIAGISAPDAKSAFIEAWTHLAYIHAHGVDKWLANFPKKGWRVYEADIELGPIE